VVVRPRGINVWWAARRQVSVPRSAVRSARVVATNGPDRPKLPPWRAPGTFIPRLVAAGTFRGRGRRQFWVVRRPRELLVVDLDRQRAPFDRLVLQVADPQAAAAALSA
jgi:hypothetical protein